MTTESDKNLQPEVILSDLDRQALELKFEGYNMKEIAEALGEKYQTVREWFANGGKYHTLYQDYAKTESELRRKEAHDTFKAHLNNAVRTLVTVMNKSKLDVARVQAAKEVINRQLGEPLKVIATDEGRVNEYLEAINKFKDAETIPRPDSSGENTDSV